MTYIPRRDITNLIPNKFEAIRVLALECRRLNDEIRAREDTEVEGKLTTLAVSQMLEGKVTYYDAKERREQERSEAMLSAAEGLLDMAEPMIEPDIDAPAMDEAVPVEGAEEAPAGEAPAEDAAAAEAAAAEAPAEDAAATEAPAEEAPAEVVTVEAPVEAAPVEVPVEEPAAEEPVAEEATEADEDTEKE
jgi:DNA-directed RNA polymerase subunit K/omega